MKSFELFTRYVEMVINKPINNTQPVYVSGLQVVEALWPLNDVFGENFEAIKGFPYDVSFEVEADQAIEDFIFNGSQLGNISAGAWRVLLERHEQALLLASVNEVEGNNLMPVPAEFPASALLGAAMLFLLHQMKLPFPIVDRTDMQIPSGSALATLKRH